MSLDKKLHTSISSIDHRQLVYDLDELRRALKRSSASWQLVEPTVARLKLDNVIERSEEPVVVTILRHAAKENRRSLKVVRRAVLDTLKPSGILDLIVSGAREVAPRLRLGALPSIEATELRAAGLTNVQVLALLRTGIHEYRTTIARTRKVDFSIRQFDRIDAMLKSLESWNGEQWRKDILEGNSGWEFFWDEVKMVAGGVIIVANIAGAVETAGATVLSIASGTGLYASGAHDMNKDMESK